MSARRLRVPQRAGATVVLILFAVVSAPAQAAKPDLVVTGKPEVSPEGPSEGYAIGLASEVKNKEFPRKKGKGPKTAPAGPSTTALLLTHKPQVPTRVAVSTEVPKLEPDESHSRTGSATLRGFPPGQYTAKVCADHRKKVKERNEDNNCADIGKVYVTIFSWRGTFSGSSHLDEGLTEEWSSSDAELFQLTAEEDGQFSYVFSGHVQYSVSGTDADGCAYSGGGITQITPVGEDALTLDYRNGEYRGSQGLGGDRPFSWSVKCGNEAPSDLEGPFDFAGGFIVADPDAAQPMPFGTTQLKATTSGMDGGITNTWTWDLSAVIPPPRTP